MGKRRSCPARRCRHRATRSVWSASSLLALLPDRDGSKAGASSTHSKRFAKLFSAPAVVVVVVESCHAPRKSLGKGWIKAMEKLGSGKRPGRSQPARAKGKSRTRYAGT